MTDHMGRSLFMSIATCLSLSLNACGGKSEGDHGNTTGGALASAGTSGIGGAAAIGGAVATGGTSGVGGSTANITACTVDADCTWTEISGEITQTSDCMCLYGCPYLVVNIDTANRRQLQYAAFCTQGKNGQGASCGVDDCIPLPKASCVQGNCSGPTN